MHKNEGYTLSSSYGLMGPIGIASTDAAAHIAWGDSRRGTVQLPTEDYYFTSVVYDTEALAASEPAGTGRQAAFFALGAVAMLAVLGGVLLVVSRRMRPA
jgi:hypothetical protein